jgi:hypothetical protein
MLQSTNGTRAMQRESVIIWERLDQPGHEWCELSRYANGWGLAGVALFVQDRKPCRVEYEIMCDTEWTTLRAHVRANIARERAELVVERASDGAWRANGDRIEVVDGCFDIDLAFSPATNLLPLRRLAPKVGEQVAARAAWVRFPELILEPLEQSYKRIRSDTYRYESAQGTFVRELTVDADGFVLEYPGLWRAEGRS